MTDFVQVPRETLQAAVDALESTDTLPYEDWMRNLGYPAIKSLKALLDAPSCEAALKVERKPLSDEQIKTAFGKLYPNDIGILELAENNRDFALEAIGARHHFAAFKAGAKAIEAAHGIGGNI